MKFIPVAEFEIQKDDANELKKLLEEKYLEYEYRSNSKMGGVFESVVILLPLVADSISTIQAFLTLYPKSKPNTIMIYRGSTEVYIQSAELSTEEIVVKLNDKSLYIEIKK